MKSPIALLLPIPWLVLWLVTTPALAGEKDVNVVNTPSVVVDNAVEIDDSQPIAVNTGEDPQLPSESVNLAPSGVDCSVGTAFQRIFDDGSVSAGFVVPDDRVFVITSVQWSSLFSTPGIAVRFAIARVGPDSVFRGALVSHATADGDGTAFGSETMPTGAVFGPGTQPCARVDSPGPAGSGENPILSAVRIQGYLATDS